MDINNLIVYENRWVLDKIYEVSDGLRFKLTNQTTFEERCIKRVGEYLTQSEDNHRHKRYILKLIHQQASDVTARYRNEETTLFTELAVNEGEEESIEFEPLDVLANVESDVINKETILLLAKEDRIREIILKAWADGNTNNKQISRTLAGTFGGKSESYRRTISRFREECRNQLATAI